MTQNIIQNEKQIITVNQNEEEQLEQNNSNTTQESKKITPNKLVENICFLKEYVTNFFSNYGFFAIAILLTLYIKYSFLEWQTGDFNGFIKNWYSYFGANNGFYAFKDSFYDYTPPYLYLLWIGTLGNFEPLYWTKTVSVFFEFVMAFFVAKIVLLNQTSDSDQVSNQTSNPNFRQIKNLWQYSFVATLLLPTVVMNSSLWGQCDSIYGSFVVGCLYFLIKKNWLGMTLCFAIGIAIKLQTIFFAPVLLVMVMVGYLPFRYLVGTGVVTILIYFLAILPAYLVGRPLLDTAQTRGLLTIYTSQSNTYKSLTMGSAATMYQWIKDEHYRFFYKAGLGIVSVATLFIVWLSSNINPNLKNRLKQGQNTDFIVKTAMLSTILVPFFLPKMHERYFFIADVISVIYAFYFPKKFWVALAVVSASTFAYFGYLLGTDKLPIYLNPAGLSVIMFFALVFVMQDWIKDIFVTK